MWYHTIGSLDATRHGGAQSQEQTMKNWTEDRIYDLVHDENSNLTATGYERSFAQRVALGENPHEVIRDLYPGAPFCSHNVRVGFNRMRTVANLIHPSPEPEPRALTIRIRVSDTEKQALTQAAEAAGHPSVSDYIRHHIPELH